MEPPFLHQLPAGGRPEGTSGDNQEKAPRDSQRGTKAHCAKVGFHQGEGDRVGLQIEDGGVKQLGNGGGGWGAVLLYLALLLIHRCYCSRAPGCGLPGSCRPPHQWSRHPPRRPDVRPPSFPILQIKCIQIEKVCKLSIRTAGLLLLHPVHRSSSIRPDAPSIGQYSVKFLAKLSSLMVILVIGYWTPKRIRKLGQYIFTNIHVESHF